jgi:hypothetical protein
MKKMILTASLLSMLVITLPGWADEAHHPGTQASPATTQMDTEKMAASVQQMQEMRKKIETEKDPATQKNLMHQHIRMMQDGMNMMSMMGGQGGMMTAKDTSAMPMGDRMAMMEKKMAVMEKMTGQGVGMMGGQGMMGGVSGKPMDDRMGMMEKKMMMMQEMLNGMMTQQEMMMK